MRRLAPLLEILFFKKNKINFELDFKKSYLRARDKVRIAKINKMHAFIVASYEVTESSKFSPPLKKNQIIARGAIPMSMIAKAARYRKGT